MDKEKFLMAEIKKWQVYIVECQNGRYYTGITNDLEKRIQKHKEGKGAYFTKRNPIKGVIYTENYDRMGPALKREAEIKKLTRKKKEILINGSST
jgi:putative endonuclease